MDETWIGIYANGDRCVGTRDEVESHCLRENGRIYRLDDLAEAGAVKKALGQGNLAVLKTTPHASVLDEERRMALAKWMERKRRNAWAAAATGEDYTDLIERCNQEIARLLNGRTNPST